MAARLNFDHELEGLHDELVSMAKSVDEAIGKAMDLFEKKDATNAKAIIDGDRMIDDMEKSIETRSLSLIMRQQPVARDLRVVSTALKVVTDLERIGDHAADIAEILMHICSLPKEQEEMTNSNYEIEHIPAMAKAAREMVHDSVEAFISNDIQSAQEIITKDDVVDDLFNSVKDDIIALLTKSNSAADYCVDILMLTKYLERIADHAVNICEWTQFHETGAINNVKIL